METTENEIWHLDISKKQFDNLKNDKRFHSLLRFTRFVNALWFFQHTLLQAEKLDFPNDNRQRIGSFFFIFSVLHEGFKDMEKMKEHFGDLPSYKQLIELTSDSRTIDLKGSTGSILRRIRNKTGFHFDEEVVKDMVKTVDLPFYRFAIGRGDTPGNIYYDMADNLFMNYVFFANEKMSESEQEKKLKGKLRDLGSLLSDFTKISQEFIFEALKHVGYRWEIITESENPSRKKE